MSEPRIAFLEHTEGGLATDAQSVTLQDPSGIYGIREAISGVMIYSPGTPTVHTDLGIYEFNIDSLDVNLEYEIFWKVLTVSGNVEYIYGLIPREVPETEGDGPTIPDELIGTGIPVDFDEDGEIDAYAYDLDGDGYFESFDLNGDGSIDEIDVGTISPGSDVEFDSRGVRVGLDGFNSEELDGIPDVPSPKGEAATDGTWGGTRGYDGVSGEVPATGGHRSNRSEDGEGDGMWDGISFESMCVQPISPRGQCMKDKALAMTRVMLKDTDSTCNAFTNDELDILLEGSLMAFNAHPTFTALSWGSIQERFLDIISKGAVIWGLYSQGVIEAGREFTITDNGISFTPPPVSDKLHSYASALLAHYEKELDVIKKNFRPVPAAVGIFSVLDISPSLRRLRHLREKQIF